MNLRQLAGPLATALIMLLAGAAIHASLTDRFGTQGNEQLQAFRSRLQRLPTSLGNWEGVDTDVDQEQIERAEIEGFVSRVFRHQDTGQTVSMFVVCGGPRQLRSHTPDVCYPAAGFEMESQPTMASLDLGLTEPAVFAKSRFYKDDGEASQRLRIYWSFSGDGVWQGPQWLRMRQAGHRALYKIYLISQIQSTSGAEEGESPVELLLKDAMPQIQSVLFPEAD